MGTKLRRFTALLAAAVFLAAAFWIERFGGNGFIPSWDQLYGWLGIGMDAPQTLASGEGGAAITFIDVGQGDAVLIAQEDAFCLIDTGTSASADDLLHSLQLAGVEELELLVLTHPHADHIGGALAVLRAIPTELVLTSTLEVEGTSAGWQALLGFLQENAIPTTVAEAGQEYAIGSGTLTVLQAGFVAPEGSQDDPVNNTSVCTRFTVGDFSYLSTGDAELDAEAALVEQYGAGLRSTLLKAGHHGSATASSEIFLQAVQPQDIVFSCGLNNEYGHPHAEVVQRCQAIGAELWRTDEQGSITFLYDGETLDVSYTAEALQPAA